MQAKFRETWGTLWETLTGSWREEWLYLAFFIKTETKPPLLYSLHMLFSAWGTAVRLLQPFLHFEHFSEDSFPSFTLNFRKTRHSCSLSHLTPLLSTFNLKRFASTTRFQIFQKTKTVSESILSKCWLSELQISSQWNFWMMTIEITWSTVRCSRGITSICLYK